jgi:hypothetical protein
MAESPDPTSLRIWRLMKKKEAWIRRKIKKKLYKMHN